MIHQPPSPLTKIARSEAFFHGRLLAAFERAKRVVEEALAGDLQLLALLGPSRVGKTEVALALLADYPACMVEGAICKPVIRVSTPPEPNLRSMSLAIIRGLDGRVLSKTSTDDLYDQACRQLRIAGVKVIIFDEIQHLSENYRNQQARRAADLLKVLSDELQISLILMGLPLAERLFEQNEQLRERCLSPVRIYPYAWVSAADRDAFAAAVALIFEAYHEAGWRIQLEADDWVRRLYAACIGRFGKLIDLFSHAETNNSARVIDLQCLENTYDHCIASQLIPANPFRASVRVSDNELNAAYVRVLNEAHLPIPKF